MLSLNAMPGVEEPPERPIKKWRTLFENKNLDHKDLIQYIQTAAPFFITCSTEVKESSELGTCTFDEEGAKSAILDVIQEFICGDKPEETLNKLRAENNVSSVCGRVFKCGEPTYSCRECSMDPTCVLCSGCFKKSSHRMHKYKMSTSSGGGCCDCGDQEAWKKDYCCEDHLVADKATEESVISEEMKEICEIVFRGILQYCVKTLQVELDASVNEMGSDGEQEDVYCTLLYNDETHTFDQVIQTLTSIVKCSQKEAIENVTSIDREGRAVVKCASFSACVKLKTEIEKKGMRSAVNTKIQPLKVAIFHKNSVACQNFAMQLLLWFQDFLGVHATLRKIFADIILSTPNSAYSLKQILMYDIKLWKSARSAWHRLLIAGMLMEYENKKELAIMFTKVYTNIMQDFIRDDHYQTFSIVSLSVQLFTVPTIAHHLIANELAFFKLMHTYYAESIEKYVKNRILQFSKNAASMTVFKRASFIITDLKYLLTFKPEVWTPELRNGFLHGVQILIRLLKCMQGMDAVTRQIGQHMEYEPEWESAFTLHIKLAHLISLVTEWCSTDKIILVKVYRMVLAALSENKFIVSQVNYEVKELADHSASCLMYDVSAKAVSIHLPLTRFLAGLYVHFEKYGLTFDNVSTTSDKPTPEQLIEPVLCCRTMISQVYSGMWRRNGYSLLNQLYFYRNVKCRTEMLDRDVIMLQIGAALIENNEYLIHILNKFNLINWTSVDYEPISFPNPEEDNIRQVINMVDEFLELLIIVIGERFVPGIAHVTENDKFKKEIMQQLCIKAFTHSELNKSLNEDYGNENDIENVIEEVAIFEKQTDKKGVYKLKDQYYNDYNMYFYHYTKEEKSKSEEMQRQRHKAQGELVCCPPPANLPKLTEPFSLITNLLQCDVMLLIMQTVLTRSLDLKAMSFSESHLQKILHLIGYAIQEEETNNYPFLTFQDRSTKWNLLPMMEELVSSARVESQRDLLIWTIKKYKELQAKYKKPSEDEMTTEPTQSSSYDTDVQSTSEQALKENRARMAAKRREQLMAQMATAQKSFISSNSEMFEAPLATEEDGTSMDWQQSPVEELKSIGCIGNNRKIVPCENQEHTCILCSEVSLVNRDCLVFPAFVQKSSILSRYQVINESDQLQSLETHIHPAPHVSTCGHVMHSTCWQEYFNNELSKETRRPFRNRTPTIFDIEKNEFLCPLCRFLSNAVLPTIPPMTSFFEPRQSLDNWNFEMLHEVMCQYQNSVMELEKTSPPEWIEVAEKDEELHSCFKDNYNNIVIKFLKEQHNIDLNETSGSTVKVNVNPDLMIFADSFVKTVRTLAHYPAISKSIESCVTTWMSCTYTIEALEMNLRAIGKPLYGEMSIRHSKVVSGLVRLCGIYGGVNMTKQNDGEELMLMPSYFYMMVYLGRLYDSIFGNQPECLLQWDIFGLLVSLIFSTRTVLFPLHPQLTIPRGDSLEHTIFICMFNVNMLKVILTVKVEDDAELITDDMEVDQETSEESLEELEHLLFLYENYNIHLYNTETKAGNRQRLAQRLLYELKIQNQTFLRCACLLFHFMTDVELPPQMADLGGDTFEVLADYLNINKRLLTYFNDPKLYEFMLKCVQHKEVETFRKNAKNTQPKTLQLELPLEGLMTIMPPIASIRQLVQLPDDYSDLINSVSLFTCRNNEREDSRNPTMCLVCGEILCSQTYCCQKELNKVLVGACTYHTDSCGAGAGIFLRMRDAEILLLGQNKGCFMSAPYLDDYGETDQGLRRGNPLHLCRESYKKLHLLWLSHGIHEEIARKTESQTHIYQIQWNHL